MRIATGSSVGSLHKQLDALHQLLYTRGGIRPSNAAVEELTKLLFIRIGVERHPDLRVGETLLADLFRGDAIAAMPDPQPIKNAFTLVNALPDLAGQPDGRHQPVWPVDEPLRISRCDVLAEAVEIINAVPIGGGDGLDAVGTAFDVFLRGRYEHAGGLGTYLTPDAVVRAMVSVAFELVEPLSGAVGGPVMGDPCCGSGRFLVGILEEATQRGCDDRDVFSTALIGADQAPSSVAMARVNLLAYGLSRPNVFAVEDSVVDASLDRLSGSLRLILTNPPFGDGKYDASDGIARTVQVFPGLGGKSRIDPAIAFVARCIHLLEPGGVAGIVLPDGVVDGPHFRDLFLGPAPLIDPVRIEGVVSLPSVTFVPAGTTAKTSIVFLRRAAADNRPVFMARADHVGFVVKKGAVAPDPDGDDLVGVAAGIRELIATGQEDTSGPLVVGAHRESLASLDASSIDREALHAREALLGAGGRPFNEFLTSERKRRAAVAEDIPFISVLHVDELGNVDWIDAETYRPTTPGIIAPAGSLIVSLLNPRKFRATVIPEQVGDVQCSAEFGVFRASVDPYAALAMLQHELVRAQIAPLGRGTSSSRRRIDAADVLTLIAPPSDSNWIEKTGWRVRNGLVAIADARRELRSAYGSID